MDQSNINEPPCFACEKCGGVMRSQKYNGIYGENYNSKGEIDKQILFKISLRSKDFKCKGKDITYN